MIARNARFKECVEDFHHVTCVYRFLLCLAWQHMSLVMRKPVFGVFDQVRFKPACSATGTSRRLVILDIETRGIKLSRKWTTKALIRLRGCAGWSAPLLFAYGKNRFSHDVAHIMRNSVKKKDTDLHAIQLNTCTCNAPVIRNHCPPHPTHGDGQGIVGLMCGALTFWVPLCKCGACDITQSTPMEFTIIKSRAMTLSRAFSRAVVMKSHCPHSGYKWLVHKVDKILILWCNIFVIFNYNSPMCFYFFSGCLWS